MLMARIRCSLVAVIMLAVLSVRAEDTSCFQRVYAAAGDAQMIVGEGGWSYTRGELHFLSAGTFYGEAALDVGVARNMAHRDPLGPIDDFCRQLADANVRLLVVPMPPKALIYPTPIGCSREEARGALEPLRLFYGVLRERNVAVLDLTEDFMKPEALAEGKLYDLTKPVWAEIGIKRAAARIAEWIGASTNLLPLGEPGATPAISRESPVLVLGDNATLAYCDGEGNAASLPIQLASQLGRAVDAIAASGSGATWPRIALIRQMNSNPSYIARKRVLIWCFAASDFTEADGWRFTPLPVH